MLDRRWCAFCISYILEHFVYKMYAKNNKTITEHFALQNVRKMLKQCQNVFWQRTCYLYSFVFCKSLRSTCKNSFLLVNILLAKMYFCITFWYILQSKMFQLFFASKKHVRGTKNTAFCLQNVKQR